MNAFRSCRMDTVSGNYLAYPHKVYRLKATKDSKAVVHFSFEDSTPIIDPLLSADWTNVQEMLDNNINIPPIRNYITSSLEERSVLLNDGIDIIRGEIKDSEPTPEPTPVPSPEPSPKLNV